MLAVAFLVVVCSVPDVMAQTEEGAVLERPALAYNALTLADSVALETLTHISTPLTLNAQLGAPPSASVNESGGVTTLEATYEGLDLSYQGSTVEALALQGFTITSAAWPLDHNGDRIAVGMDVDSLPEMVREAMTNGEARLFLVPTKDVEGGQQAPHAELVVEARDAAVVQMRFRALP
jgi:hypothetical protein